MSRNNQLGFSLIETLVVLFIVTIILTISVPATHSLLMSVTEKKILEQFEYDVLFLQNQSLVTNDYLRMVLDPSGYTITGGHNQNIERKLPNGWRIDRRSMQNISFNENGSIRQAGTIQILTPTNTYNIVFPIGKGRGYIEKQ